MDNAYQAIVVIFCPSCDHMASIEMPTQEVYDGDKRKITCQNCGQEMEIIIDIHIRKIDEPPF